MPRLTVKAAIAGACLAVVGLSAGLGLAQPSPAPSVTAPSAAPGAASASGAPTPYGEAPHTGGAPRSPRPRLVRPHAPVPGPAVAPPAPGQPLAPAQPLPVPELEAYVDGLVADGMAGDHIAGVTVSVVQNGQVVLKKGYGVSSFSPARPVDPDRTLFRLASISKTFTSILLMKEVEAGHMRLDGPVNVYLPQALQVKDQGFKQQITLRELIDHSAGFENRALGQLFERDPGRVRSLVDYLSQEHPRRIREAGAAPAYTNYGVALAGEAVANVTGKPFEDLAEAEIIRPLGLLHTTFREPRPARPGLPAPLTGSMAGDISEGYRWTQGGFERRPPEFIGQVAPAGSLSSTAGDMSRYMLLLLGGGSLDGVTIYGPATAAAFATPVSRPLPGATGWNAGFQEVRLPGGVTGFGHTGISVSFRSNMVIVPSLNLGVFISANTESGADLTKRLPEKIVERFYHPQAGLPPAPSAALFALRKTYEGRYLTNDRAYGRLEGFVDMFVAGQTVRVTPEGYLVTAGQEGTRRWVSVGDPAQGVFRGIEGPDRLVFDVSRGRATRFVAPWGGEVFERAGPLFGTGALATLAALTALSAVLTLAGLVLRDRREFRETQWQARASLMQTTQAVLLLMSMALFGVWASGAGDRAHVLYDWPSGWMVAASALTLVSYILAVVTVFILIFVWRGGRRLDSWSGWRKLRFTATALIFFCFGSLLMFWGAILPWVA